MDGSGRPRARTAVSSRTSLHQLRTPLAALVAEASILRDDLDSLPAGTRRAGELLIGDVARLRTLVDDLMEVSRFDAEAEHFASRESVDLVRVVETVVANRLPEAQLTLPRGPVTIETDPRRLERIIGNLLDNAREHAPGSPVEVSFVATDEELTIAIEDRGPGVEPDRLDRTWNASTKPIHHATAAAADSDSRSRPSTRPSWAESFGRRTGRVAA